MNWEEILKDEKQSKIKQILETAGVAAENVKNVVDQIVDILAGNRPIGPF